MMMNNKQNVGRDYLKMNEYNFSIFYIHLCIYLLPANHKLDKLLSSIYILCMYIKYISSIYIYNHLVVQPALVALPVGGGQNIPTVSLHVV